MSLLVKQYRHYGDRVMISVMHGDCNTGQESEIQYDDWRSYRKRLRAVLDGRPIRLFTKKKVIQTERDRIWCNLLLQPSGNFSLIGVLPGNQPGLLIWNASVGPLADCLAVLRESNFDGILDVHTDTNSRKFDMGTPYA